MNTPLDYYATPGEFTTLHLTQPVPNDVAALCALTQNLVIHWFVAGTMYGVDIAPEREGEAHLRYAQEILDGALKLDNRDPMLPRSGDNKLVGVCHHFAKLLIALLRAQHIPARMRYGFGDYFHPGFYEDHSLVEYWDADKQRWVLLDPQFDAVWQQHIAHDVMDVPREHFLMPAISWQRCRQGELDAATFGTINGEMRGLWFIAGNLVKDLAAPNKMELLQWDAWTEMPRPNNSMSNKMTLAFFDKLAALLLEPDANFAALKAFYADEGNGVKVPERVFNALHRHLER